MPVNPRILELMGMGQGPASPANAEQWRPRSPWLGGGPNSMDRPAPPAVAPAEKGIFGFNKMGAPLSQALMGFSSGLLSRGYGESYGQALGRGLTAGSQGALAGRRQERAQKARDYMKTLASSTVNPEDAEIYGLMAEMENPASMMPSMIANRGADRRASAQMQFSRGQAEQAHERSKARGELSSLRMIDRQEQAEARKAGTPKGQAGTRAYNLHLAKHGDADQRKQLGLPPGTGFAGNQALQQEYDDFMKISASQRFMGGIYDPLAYGDGGAAATGLPEFSDPDVQ